MKYYPKSQIKTGLFTKGNEFVYSQTNQPYKGYYWATSTGEYYTGKNPDERPSSLIIPITQTNSNTLLPDNSIVKNNEINSYYIIDPVYNSIKNKSNSIYAPSYPTQYNPSPTQEDYTNGYFTRYFAKKNNTSKYIEISQKEYTLYSMSSPTVQSELYSVVNIKWYITGQNAYVDNQSSVIQIENSIGWYGFTQYFKEKFDKFVK